MIAVFDLKHENHVSVFRKIMADDKLKDETIKAQEEEKERQKWLQVF